MKRKANIVIRMGASKFEATVRNGDKVYLYDLRRMTKKQEHDFRVELVAQFREAGLQQKAA
jgi:hypothetical protein